MFEKVILIDTNIWHFAYKMPKEEKYIQIHKLANKFLKDIFSQHTTQIGMSSYQIIVSNIHIYDYLVAFPLKGLVSKIYSADDHFQHKDFKAIAEVINPLSPWILREGKRPTIQNEDS